MVTAQADGNFSALFLIAVTPNSSSFEPVPALAIAPIKFELCPERLIENCLR
jgi:hypothetical protein